ncbi:MAG TPA: cytochrome d ubiquinol oxidase subunit II [Methyloceanibacter sp.]|jgi:cytochrome bd ubiquinol oxidase subunit II|nr:cytochrome d ubiquinol oxidase subunit II [Methyloceanibacter sp.]
MTEQASQMTEYLPVLLPLVWAAILALAVFLYVLLGGYDLGLGVLFPLAPSDKDRDAMMASVAPFWDGNETWLVLGGGGLLAAFPLAYSVMLPALYIPIILMLMGLILRGVAFEFRFKSERSRWVWDLAFSVGSILAALMQGVIIGAFIQGFAVNDNQFSGGAFDWLSPFSVLTAAAVLAGYVLLSAGWLIMKADEALREWAYGIANIALVAVAAFIVIFSIWTPLLHAEIAARWFTPANMVMLSPVPLITAASIVALWTALKRRQRYTPFLLGAALFLLCYTGLGVSLFPFIIPPDITIWQAAAAPESQLFMLYGAVPILPIILGYTAYSYWALWEAPEHDAYH